MADKYQVRVQSKFAPEITICSYPSGKIPRGYASGWSLEKDGRTDSPLALIPDEKIRKLVMAEASDLTCPLNSKETFCFIIGDGSGKMHGVVDTKIKSRVEVQEKGIREKLEEKYTRVVADVRETIKKAKSKYDTVYLSLEEVI